MIPQVLDEYVSDKRSELDNQWLYSAVVGFDFYHYERDFGCTLGKHYAISP